MFALQKNGKEVLYDSKKELSRSFIIGFYDKRLRIMPLGLNLILLNLLFVKTTTS
jgi:hypothetical protein